jgi:integrase
MARKATGQIIERDEDAGRVGYRSLRFRARVAGETRTRWFISLGLVSRDEAQRKLRGILADVERGIWRPDDPTPVCEPAPGAQTFHEFAELWWLDNVNDWAPATRDDYRWRLENHLLPFFGGHRLDQITIAEVDRYRARKRAPDADGKQLSPRTVNMTLITLSAILEIAEERELISRNSARGKRRRVRRVRSPRSYLDTAEQITAFLDAARALDARAASNRKHIPRYAIVATLVFAGLRISELLSLRWRDVDLANGRISVADAKTEAGIRFVTIRGPLRSILIALKMERRPRANHYVFASATGGVLSDDNIRKRVIRRSIEVANEMVADDAIELPALTPHGCRRTFASLLYAIGEPPPVVMAEMGHTDPALALSLYARVMRYGPEQRAKLVALMGGQSDTNAQTAHYPVNRPQNTAIGHPGNTAAEAA